MTRPLARNIVEKLRGIVDPNLMEELVALAEYQNVQRQQIQQLAQLVNTCVDEINKLASVVGLFKSRLEKFKEHLPRGLEADE